MQPGGPVQPYPAKPVSGKIQGPKLPTAFRQSQNVLCEPGEEEKAGVEPEDEDHVELVEGGGVHGGQTFHRPENHRPGIVVGVFELGQREGCSNQQKA